jgi:hypothetical protein
MKNRRVRKTRRPNQICDETEPTRIPERVWKQFPLIKGNGKNEYKYVAPQEYSDGYVHFQLQYYPPKKKGGLSTRLKHIKNFKYAKVAALYFAIIKARKLYDSDEDGTSLARIVENIIYENPHVDDTMNRPSICNLKQVFYNIKFLKVPPILKNIAC